MSSVTSSGAPSATVLLVSHAQSNDWIYYVATVQAPAQLVFKATGTVTLTAPMNGVASMQVVSPSPKLKMHAGSTNDDIYTFLLTDVVGFSGLYQVDLSKAVIYSPYPRPRLAIFFQKDT